MVSPRPNLTSPVLVTGLSGNLGQHVAPQFKDRLLVGVDLYPPRVDHPQVQFCQLDLSQPDAVSMLEALIRDNQVRQVLHLAFVLDPLRTGSLTRERQWEINVRGTEHLLDAIERVNHPRRQVDCFLYPSSVTSYGPQLPHRVDEDYPQQPRIYAYAVHKKETEDLCRARHPRLNGCALYILRGHIFLGADVDNFVVRALRGQPSSRTWLGRCLLRWQWRLPLVFPSGEPYRGLYQFMHIDDAARLLAWLCRHYEPARLRVLNVQGRGSPLTAEDCARLAGLRLLRLPSYALVGLLHRLAWAIGLSAVPGDAYPYFVGSYVMSTERLERILGRDYAEVIRYTTEEAFRETFAGATQAPGKHDHQGFSQKC